jgi:HAD superfamily hydrolase (TIGR01509 family)
MRSTEWGLPMDARLHAVLWDMDGMILDSEPLWHKAICEYVGERGGELADDDRAELIGAPTPRMLAIVCAAAGVEPTPEIAADIMQFMDRRVSELMVDSAGWQPGAKQALDLTREAGLRCALVTNASRRITESGLDIIGRKYFAASVSSDDVIAGKPAPYAHLRASELLGVSPKDCVAVEDSHVGAHGAEAAGCGVVVVGLTGASRDGPAQMVRTSLLGLGVADLQQALVLRDLSIGGRR